MADFAWFEYDYTCMFFVLLTYKTFRNLSISSLRLQFRQRDDYFEQNGFVRFLVEYAPATVVNTLYRIVAIVFIKVIIRFDCALSSVCGIINNIVQYNVIVNSRWWFRLPAAV